MTEISKAQFVTGFRYREVIKQAACLHHSHGLVIVMNTLSKYLAKEFL